MIEYAFVIHGKEKGVTKGGFHIIRLLKVNFLGTRRELIVGMYIICTFLAETYLRNMFEFLRHTSVNI